MKFRSRTVYVDAVRLSWSTWSEVCELLQTTGGELALGCRGCYLDANGIETDDCNGRIGLKIPTSGPPNTFVMAGEGDWIVRDAEGKIYPVSAENFKKQFESDEVDEMMKARESEKKRMRALFGEDDKP